MRPTEKTPVAAQQVIKNRQYRYKNTGCEKFHKGEEAEGVYMAEADDGVYISVLTLPPLFSGKKIKKIKKIKKRLGSMQTFAHLYNIFVCFFVEKIKKIKKLLKGFGWVCRFLHTVYV